MMDAAVKASEIPELHHDEAMRLAEGEYARLVALAESLSPEDWGQPTECPGWDVKAVLGHLLGEMKLCASAEEGLRQAGLAGEAAQQTGVAWIDALTDVQVREHAGLSPADIVAGLRACAPLALSGRSGAGAEERATTFNPGPPYEEEWSRGYLLDVILTRDPWMHRMDICRAIGRAPELSAAHDGRLVADVVAEWARRHGQAFSLILDGPAGGRFVEGAGGEEHHLDAIDFCRLLSGRGAGAGLLCQHVPF